MIKVLLFDFSGVILFSKAEAYTGKLNDLYRSLPNSFRFEDYFRFNTELLTFLETMKDKYTLAIFTTETIQNDPAVKARLGGLFSVVYSANELGLIKKDPSAYTFIAGKLGKDPAEIVFIDDRIENVEAAVTAGMKGIRFESTSHFETELTSLFS